ncbi:TVP38/TMEM64 family protein [Lentzea aerocolonigenes]|uniref:TVP38/TMEM64 family protein n=1 Tax=Lentzea aerocolonigenes TaxID=68170 RepID=UPI00068EA258|nr:VTT domain-containing protein [Lentzea aerocolonigenes]MCP2244383.1 putative membrane protein YdjX, TVP38/TMEM64 family, SNARE-associated domain [Lentzea aerocolonigenes]
MRRGGLILLVLLVVALAVLAQFVEIPDGAVLRDEVGKAGGAAPLVFAVVCALGTAVFFPKPVLATAAGLLFGVGWGSVLAIAGFTAGAMIAFTIARRLGRAAVEGWLGERLHVLEQVFARKGVEATLVIRLLPVVPFTLANYGAGVTSVRDRHFAAGTALGLVPSTVLAAVLGDALSDLGSPRSIAALSIWAVLAAVGVWWGRNLITGAARAS